MKQSNVRRGPREAGHAMARQWEMIKLLPRGSQGATAAALAEQLASLGYSTSRRTVERDLVDLQDRFPVAAVPGTRPQQWIAQRDVDLGGISLGGALSLHLMAKFLSPLVPHAVVGQLAPLLALASSKLDAQQGSGLGSWPDKVAVADTGPGTQPARVDEAVLEAVQDALLAGCKITASYTRSDASEAEGQVMSPLGLVLQGNKLYLVAVRHTGAAAKPRAYPLHRMRRAARSYEPAEVPEGFDLNAFVASEGMRFGSGRKIKLDAWVSPTIALQLAASPLSPDQELSQDSAHRYRLHASVLDTWRLRWWIMQHTGHIVVVGPTELRTAFAAALQRGAGMYSSKRKPVFGQLAPSQTPNQSSL